MADQVDAGDRHAAVRQDRDGDARRSSRRACGQGRFEITEAGLHRLSDGKLEAVAAAGNADPKETADIVATAAKLEPVAQATGGGLFWLDDRTAPPASKCRAGRQMAGSGWIGLESERRLSVSPPSPRSRCSPRC